MQVMIVNNIHETPAVSAQSSVGVLSVLSVESSHTVCQVNPYFTSIFFHLSIMLFMGLDDEGVMSHNLSVLASA